MCLRNAAKQRDLGHLGGDTNPHPILLSPPVQAVKANKKSGLTFFVNGWLCLSLNSARLHPRLLAKLLYIF